VTATLAAGRLYARALTATATSTATIRRQVGKTLSATATSSATIRRLISLTLSAQATVTAVITALASNIAVILATITGGRIGHGFSGRMDEGEHSGSIDSGDIGHIEKADRGFVGASVGGEIEE
jgi:hypothetical protein